MNVKSGTMGAMERRLMRGMIERYGLDEVLFQIVQHADYKARELALCSDVAAAKSWAYASEAIELTAHACQAV